MGFFQLEQLVEGIINFQETKEYLANLFLFLKKVVTVGYSTEDSREGVLMTFLFDINKQSLSPSLPVGLYWPLAL